MVFLMVTECVDGPGGHRATVISIQHHEGEEIRLSGIPCGKHSTRTICTPIRDETLGEIEAALDLEHWKITA